MAWPRAKKASRCSTFPAVRYSSATTNGHCRPASFVASSSFGAARRMSNGVERLGIAAQNLKRGGSSVLIRKSPLSRRLIHADAACSGSSYVGLSSERRGTTTPRRARAVRRRSIPWSFATYYQSVGAREDLQLLRRSRWDHALVTFPRLHHLAIGTMMHSARKGALRTDAALDRSDPHGGPVALADAGGRGGRRAPGSHPGFPPAAKISRSAFAASDRQRRANAGAAARRRARHADAHARTVRHGAGASAASWTRARRDWSTCFARRMSDLRGSKPPRTPTDRTATHRRKRARPRRAPNRLSPPRRRSIRGTRRFIRCWMKDCPPRRSRIAWVDRMEKWN